jgi:hypothetical protein
MNLNEKKENFIHTHTHCKSLTNQQKQPSTGKKIDFLRYFG